MPVCRRRVGCIAADPERIVCVTPMKSLRFALVAAPRSCALFIQPQSKRAAAPQPVEPLGARWHCGAPATRATAQRSAITSCPDHVGGSVSQTSTITRWRDDAGFPNLEEFAVGDLIRRSVAPTVARRRGEAMSRATGLSQRGRAHKQPRRRRVIEIPNLLNLAHHCL
jgi:hypothetical protein